ncbi:MULTISPECIES: hypothetical protein [Acidocella]|uniref:hypothetical protein n=1 Tax=Acidocella TaxID=50709 RepID=UPI0003473ED1|nr:MULTISPECIES: hypothetical protein [Acidocella]
MTSTHPEGHAHAPASEYDIDFDTPARQGWQRFGKFLALNVAAVVFGLLFIGALTVWR